MSKALSDWARAERGFIRDELKWFNNGAELIAPSGEDITLRKIDELNARLEHLSTALSES